MKQWVQRGSDIKNQAKNPVGGLHFMFDFSCMVKESCVMKSVSSKSWMKLAHQVQASWNTGAQALEKYTLRRYLQDKSWKNTQAKNQTSKTKESQGLDLLKKPGHRNDCPLTKRPKIVRKTCRPTTSRICITLEKIQKKNPQKVPNSKAKNKKSPEKQNQTWGNLPATSVEFHSESLRSFSQTLSAGWKGHSSAPLEAKEDPEIPQTFWSFFLFFWREIKCGTRPGRGGFSRVIVSFGGVV